MQPASKKICKFFLEKKKRGCKFEVYKSSEFCFHHYEGDDIFMPCPLDPNHTVLKSHLERHLLICPKIQYKKKLEQSVWYKEGVNLPKTLDLKTDDWALDGNPEENDNYQKKSKHYLQSLSKTHPEEYKNLVESVKTAFHKALELYRESLQKTENISGIDIDTLCSEEYLLDLKGHIKVVDNTISDTQKNTKQCENLVQSLKNFDLLKNKVCFIEYGAGKGALSHHIAINVEDCSNILIELEGRRNKMDKNHREGNAFYRIRADIKDFDINKVPAVFQEQRANKSMVEEDPEESKTDVLQEEQKVVGVSKHMCGGASDLTFYSILNAEPPVCPYGFMIATCCHHRCTQDLYLNHDFLSQVGLGANQKRPFFHISSWGIYRENLEKCPQKNQNKDQEDLPFGLDSDTKTVLGLQAKRTLDIGRILRLREKGFNCYLVKYCEKVLSPENFVIIGRESSTKQNCAE